MNEIQKMFDKLSKNYDIYNNIISLGLHKKVRRNAIKTLNIKNGSKILDLCCGTGDFGEIVKKLYPTCEVTGADFSEEMLKIAKNKNGNIKYILQNATNMNFEANTFDYVISAFGLRNIKDKNSAAGEINRVLKPAGKFLQLDFGEKSIFNDIYDFFVLKIMKLLTADIKPYKYLINSKNNFLTPEEISNLFEKYGFYTDSINNRLFGIISFQIFVKK